MRRSASAASCRSWPSAIAAGDRETRFQGRGDAGSGSSASAAEASRQGAYRRRSRRGKDHARVTLVIGLAALRRQYADLLFSGIRHRSDESISTSRSSLATRHVSVVPAFLGGGKFERANASRHRSSRIRRGRDPRRVTTAERGSLSLLDQSVRGRAARYRARKFSALPVRTTVRDQRFHPRSPHRRRSRRAVGGASGYAASSIRASRACRSSASRKAPRSRRRVRRRPRRTPVDHRARLSRSRSRRVVPSRCLASGARRRLRARSGLTHLGLAPTNVIVTVKATQINDLESSPRRCRRDRSSDPARASRSVHGARAARGRSDLGGDRRFQPRCPRVRARHGQRAYTGDTPQQVAQACSRSATEPPLPRPHRASAATLPRALAFERFPEHAHSPTRSTPRFASRPSLERARTSARDVKQTMDRLAAMNEGSTSGILALTMVGNAARLARNRCRRSRARQQGSAQHDGDDGTGLHRSVDVRVLARGRTFRATAVGGGPVLKHEHRRRPVAPPPIPVPPGVTPPPPSVTTPSATMLRAAVKPPAIPAIPGKGVRRNRGDRCRTERRQIPTIAPQKPPMTPRRRRSIQRCSDGAPAADFDVDTSRRRAAGEDPRGSRSRNDGELDLEIEIDKRLGGHQHIRPRPIRASANRGLRAIGSSERRRDVTVMAEIQIAANSPRRICENVSADDEPSVAFGRVRGAGRRLEGSFAETERS